MTHYPSSRSLFQFAVVALSLGLSAAFSILPQPLQSHQRQQHHVTADSTILNSQRRLRLHPLFSASSSRRNDDTNFLMDAYRDPTTGQILDPYAILKIPRNAQRQQIKQAYRALSRRYHPDTMIHRDILPGACNNLEDVRNHWERVKLSYEILSDPRSRKRFDRHEALADPQKALSRAASQAAVSAVTSLGKGLWGLGTTMVQGAAKVAVEAREKQQQMEQEKRQQQHHAASVQQRNNNNNNNKNTKNGFASPFHKGGSNSTMIVSSPPRMDPGMRRHQSSSPSSTSNNNQEFTAIIKRPSRPSIIMMGGTSPGN